MIKNKLDRRAIMRDAHRQLRNSKRLGLGWTWSKCCCRAWEAAQGRRVFFEQLNARKRDIIRLAA